MVKGWFEVFDAVRGTAVRLVAPAKVNLRLKLVGRRADGYHLLSMLNHSLSLADELEVSYSEQGAVTVQVVPDGVVVEPPERNSVWRAFHLFWAAFADLSDGAPPPVGLSCRLLKRIPVGAGLGGGSSDAAAVLRLLWRDFAGAIQQRWGLGADQVAARIAGAALACGADVPYALHGGLCAVAGIGEQVVAVPGPRLLGYRVALLVPAVAVSTAAFFEYLRARRPPMLVDPAVVLADPELEAFKAASGLEGLERLLENDFEGAVCELAPEVGAGLRLARQYFPDTTSVSGSGSSFFSLVQVGEERALTALTEAARAAGITPHLCDFVEPVAAGRP